MKDIFISYKTEDIADARKVRDHLEAEGLSVWMAPDSITGGASYAAEIPPAIDNAKVFVLILSQKAQTSKWVPRELDQAINGDKKVMPFMIEDCPLNSEFKFYLTNIQRYPAYENYDKSLKKMTDEIKQYLAPPKQEKKIVPPPAPKKDKPPKAKNPKQKGKKGIIALGVIFAIILASVVMNMLNTLTIAGEDVKKDDTAIHFYKKELTQEDIDNIAKMKGLRVVSFEECNISASDLSGIVTESLYNLSIENCNLTKAQLETLDLSACTLNTVELSGCQLDSLALIENQAKSLYTLKISNTNVSDISMVSRFTKLTDFEADNCQIADISPLSACENLANLSLDDNNIESLEPISSLTKLTNISVNGNKLKNLNGLEKSIELKKLQAGYNSIENIDGLANATLLSNVLLSGNELSDISVLAKSAEKLGRVYLADNHIEDASALENAVNIQYLNLADNKITDLAWMKNMSKLIALDLSRNAVEGSVSLDGMVELKYLVMSGNKLSGVKGALKNENYAVAAFDGTEMADFGIEYTGIYRKLLLNGANVADFSKIYSSKGDIVLDYSEQVDLDKLKEAGYSHIILIGVPLDKQVAIKEKLGSGTVEFADQLIFDIKSILPQEVYGDYTPAQ